MCESLCLRALRGALQTRRLLSQTPVLLRMACYSQRSGKVSIVGGGRWRGDRLHLNFLQLEITLLLMDAPWGYRQRRGRRGEWGIALKGELCVGDGFGVTAPHPLPWQCSATLTRPNLSSPEREVINY